MSAGAGPMSRGEQVRASLSALVSFYEHLTPASLTQIRMLYAPQAYFKDPFNEVEGIANIERIFAHMFAQVTRPRFVVDTTVLEGDQALLCWRFSFVSGGRDIEVRGASHVRFDAEARVCLHRDYWDTGEELYAKFPLLGPLVRALARRLSARPKQ